jgi:hypothetical protein
MMKTHGQGRRQTLAVECETNIWRQVSKGLDFIHSPTLFDLIDPPFHTRWLRYSGDVFVRTCG